MVSVRRCLTVMIQTVRLVSQPPVVNGTVGWRGWRLRGRLSSKSVRWAEVGISSSQQSWSASFLKLWGCKVLWKLILQKTIPHSTNAEQIGTMLGFAPNLKNMSCQRLQFGQFAGWRFIHKPEKQTHNIRPNSGGTLSIWKFNLQTRGYWYKMPLRSIYTIHSSIVVRRNGTFRLFSKQKIWRKNHFNRRNPYKAPTWGLPSLQMVRYGLPLTPNGWPYHTEAQYTFHAV